MHDKSSKWSDQHIESPTMQANQNNYEQQAIQRANEIRAKKIASLESDIANIQKALSALNECYDEKELTTAISELGALKARLERELFKAQPEA
jgi:hypothetical protein